MANEIMKNTEKTEISTIASGKERIKKVIPMDILNWGEILKIQPEKEEVLRGWFNETGNWPVRSSIPVMDLTDGKVYPAYSLDYNTSPYGGSVGRSVWIKIKHCVEEGEPLIASENCLYSEEYKRFNGHIFIDCSHVDVVILQVALKKYKEVQKETRYAVEKLIQEKFENKIDGLIFMTKCITEELEKIKKSK